MKLSFLLIVHTMLNNLTWRILWWVFFPLCSSAVLILDSIMMWYSSTLSTAQQNLCLELEIITDTDVWNVAVCKKTTGCSNLLFLVSLYSGRSEPPAWNPHLHTVLKNSFSLFYICTVIKQTHFTGKYSLQKHKQKHQKIENTYMHISVRSMCFYASLSATAMGRGIMFVVYLSLQLSDRLIRFWWSNVRDQGHCDRTKHVFGQDKNSCVTWKWTLWQRNTNMRL